MKKLYTILLIFFFFWGFSNELKAQIGILPKAETKPFGFTGYMNLSAEYYSMNYDSELPISARRPANLYRLIFSPNINIYELKIPITIMLSSRQNNTLTYQTPGQNFLQMLQNPLNTVRIAPSYKWVTLILGTQVVRYSYLTTGDAPLFGIGLELKPGKFFFGGFMGSAQRAIEPDSARRVLGAYKRNFRAYKVGYGVEKEFNIFMSFVYSDDDLSSVNSTPVNIFPQEGMNASLNINAPLTEQIYWENELAFGVFTRNKFSDEINNGFINSISPFVKPRESTRGDVAANSRLNYSSKDWGVAAQVLYLGDGYKPMGFPYMQSDRLDLTLSPRVRLFENKLNLSATLGLRKNNISNTKSSTTEQLLGSLNANAIITDNFGFYASYSNFGIRNKVTIDTFSIQTISQSISLAPYYNFQTELGENSINLNLTYDNYTDDNLISGEINSNSTVSAYISYLLSFNKFPLTLESNVSTVQNSNEIYGLEIYSIGVGASYRFWENKLRPRARLIYSNSATGIHSADNQVLLRPGIQYAITRSLSIQADGSLNFYSYGSSRPNSSYTENYLRFSFSSRF